MSEQPSAILCLITDRKLLAGRALEDVVSEAVMGGVNYVQLREKEMGARELLEVAQSLRRVIGNRAALIVNDRVDVALACDADAVHLPERGLPAREVRKILGKGKLIGRSVHSIADTVNAAREGADYVQLGPIFATSSHPDAQPLGLKTLETACREVSIPVIGVGGIDANTAMEVIKSGANGIAVISAILKACDPRTAAQTLREAMRKA